MRIVRPLIVMPGRARAGRGTGAVGISARLRDGCIMDHIMSPERMGLLMGWFEKGKNAYGEMDGGERRLECAVAGGRLPVAGRNGWVRLAGFR